MDGVMLILYNEEKKILLQYRTSDAPRYPSHWSFFGGGFEKGETPEEAVKREVCEEVNYKLKNPVLLNKKEIPSDGVKYYFIEKYVNDQELKLQEGEKMEWFTIPEMKEIKLIPHQKEELDRIERYFSA